MAMATEDYRYFDEKFDKVYDAVNEVKENIVETQKEVIKAQDCIGNIKNNINEHKTTKCENIQDHYKDYHEISWGRTLVVVLSLLTIISSLIYLIKEIT